MSRIYVQTWQDTYLSVVPVDYLLSMSVAKNERAFYDELKNVIPKYGQFYQPTNFDDVDRNKVNQIIRLVANEDLGCGYVEEG